MTRGLVVLCSPAAAERLRRLVDGRVDVFFDRETAPGDLPIVAVGDPAAQPDDPRIVHVVRPALDDDSLRALLVAIGSRKVLEPPAPLKRPDHPAEARLLQLAFAASRPLMGASDARAAEGLAVEAILELTDADRAYCLFYSPRDGSLWSEDQLARHGDDRRATGGIAGWASHTGLAAVVPRLADDPRWLPAIDDPVGDGDCQLIAQPIVGVDEHTHAVLIAIKRHTASEHERERVVRRDAELMSHLARFAAPGLDQLTIEYHAQLLVSDAEGGDIFQPEALAARGPQPWGDVVRVSPVWMSWGYRILVGLFAATIVLVCLARVSTYSSGPALVRSNERTVATSRTAGSIAAVDVKPGDRIAAGAVIARLSDSDQRAAAERVSLELEAQLRNHMLDPADLAADGAVRSLRLELERLRLGIEERIIRAPVEGIVSDLRVRPGQHVEPGDIAATIVNGDGGLEVIALLPGADRPQLAPGMELRLELVGYRYTYQTITLDSVSSDVISATEARRILGPEVSDGLELRGPVVLVRGRLPWRAFEVDGHELRLYDGMLGTGEVRLRSERVLFAIVPGLRGLLQ